jgi:hypothetical protein
VAVGSGGEVERVVAVEVDVLVGERGDVLDLAGGDQFAGGAELIEDACGVDGVPGDDRVDDDRDAERLLRPYAAASASDKNSTGTRAR